MPPTKCKCVVCDFCSGRGFWLLHIDDPERRDCYGCDGSGIETKCDACFGPECHACETRTLTPTRGENGLIFCGDCFEDLLERNDDE